MCINPWKFSKNHAKDLTVTATISAKFLITGSIACSASRRYLIYSEADFEVFCLVGATRCTDVVKFGTDPPCQISTHRCNGKGVGPQELTVLLRFDQNVEYKRPPQGRIPCVIFIKFPVCTPFHDELVVKIWLHLLEGLWSYGGFKLRRLVTPKFSAPHSGETMCQTPKVLKAQERARGPLSPCQVWWGTDFTRRRGGQKHWVFVCLFVCPSCFWMSEFVRPISPWSRWSTETILMLLDRGRFIVVHPCSTFWDWCQLATSHKCRSPKKWQKLGFFAARGWQNKPIETKFRR